MVYTRDPDFVKDALEKVLCDRFQGDDYTIRLWEAEAKLESLCYTRGRDGRWRKKITDAEVKEMAEIRSLAWDTHW